MRVPQRAVIFRVAQRTRRARNRVPFFWFRFLWARKENEPAQQGGKNA